VVLKVIVAISLALALTSPALEADPQTFKTEESATKFCHAGNVVLRAQDGGRLCLPPVCDKAGFRARKGN
jgi:hypothetical protein